MLKFEDIADYLIILQLLYTGIEYTEFYMALVESY